MSPGETSPEMKAFLEDLKNFYEKHVENRSKLKREKDQTGVIFEEARSLLHMKGYIDD